MGMNSYFDNADKVKKAHVEVGIPLTSQFHMLTTTRGSVTFFMNDSSPFTNVSLLG